MNGIEMLGVIAVASVSVLMAGLFVFSWFTERSK